MIETILVDSAIAGAECIHQNGDRFNARPRRVRWSKVRRGAPGADPIWFTDGHLDKAGNARIGRKTIGLLLEPPQLHPENYQQANDVLAANLLDVLYTHHPEAFSLSYTAVRAYPFGGTRIHESDWRIHPKTVWKPSMVFSDKDSLPGHRLRHDLAHAYATPERVDDLHLYGPGSGLAHLDHKVNALERYAFSVAIENVNTGLWFTEALLDCFLTGTIPIYWGSRDALETWGFDQGGVLPVSGVPDICALIDHLSDPRVAKSTYNHMRPEVERNFIKAHEYTCTEDWLWRNDPTLFSAGAV